MKNNEDDFDESVSADEQELIEQLSEQDIEQIDQALLANAAQQWRKVARVVGTTMLEQKSRVEGIPDIYYAQRIAKLVDCGLLQAQGDLRRMRFSEVRLPAVSVTAITATH